MKIVTWNAAGKFREKFNAVQALGADIYVIQECEDPRRCKSVAYADWALTRQAIWWGLNKNRGLGVFAAPHISLADNAWDSGGVRFLGSVRVNGDFDLVGVWANPAGKYKPYRSYVQQIKHYVSLHESKISASTVLLGDFNSNQRWAKVCGADSHASLAEQLNRIGLRSAWHVMSGEEPGKESHTTFVHRSNKKAYHIDYAFSAPSRVLDCTIDNSRDWLQLSDHRPLVLEQK